MIKTAKDIQCKNFAEKVLKSRRLRTPDIIEDITVEAEVNHGRWIINCPYCSGAEMADPDDKKFYCLSCYNQGKGYLKVKFPFNKDKIEAELLKRPVENQHYLPGEKLSVIKQENKERGIHGMD